MWIKENFKYPLREHFLYSAAKLLVVVNKAIGLVSSPFWQQINQCHPKSSHKVNKEHVGSTVPAYIASTDGKRFKDSALV